MKENYRLGVTSQLLLSPLCILSIVLSSDIHRLNLWSGLPSENTGWQKETFMRFPTGLLSESLNWHTQDSHLSPSLLILARMSMGISISPLPLNLSVQ